MSVGIIPVIDLLDGQVVHARGGQRDRYEPIRTPLCPGAEPEAVVRALLALGEFPALYAADLGALQGRGDHSLLLQRLRRLFPRTEFWVDTGARAPTATGNGLRTVIGTESGVTAAALARIDQSGAGFVLSLDFTAAGYAGDPDVLANPACWPRDVILMHLPGVGGSRGPDWDLLDPILARAGDRNWYVAGGVRDQRDLAAAATRGIRGVLVATALHAGTLRPDA